MTATTGEAINSNPCETVDSRLQSVMDGIKDGAKPHPSELPVRAIVEGQFCLNCFSHADSLASWVQLFHYCKHCAPKEERNRLIQPCNRLFRPQRHPEQDVYYFYGYLLGFRTVCSWRPSGAAAG